MKTSNKFRIIAFVALLLAGALILPSCHTKKKCNDCPGWSRTSEKKPSHS
ncbi:MAG: hypothetical protein WCM76_08655 [Bacteroidota bacterium]